MDVPYRLSRGLAFLMAGQSLTGLLFQTQYHDADWIKAAWFANDWLTAVAALPLLALGAIRARAGSERGTLLWLGVVSYAVYNYAYYLFGTALNVFFPAYLAAFVVSILILILALPRLAVEKIAAGFGSLRSARLAGGFFTLTGIGLMAAWITMWGAYVFAGRATPVPPEAFKLVAALDLSLMVPSLTAGGVLLWRRHPWGYVITALASVQASLYLAVLTGGSLVAVYRGLAPAPGEVPIWGTMFLITTRVTIAFFAGARGVRPHRRRIDSIATGPVRVSRTDSRTVTDYSVL